MKKKKTSRRSFIKKLSAISLATSSGAALEAAPSLYFKPGFSPNDKIRVAAIGMGIIGFYNTRTAVRVPGVELVAVADCYDGRLTRSREVFGEEIQATRNYQELLSRSDIDAVFICAPDHWHAQMAVDAMEAGKAVYIEKPLIQKIEDGHRIIKVQQATKQVAQVGSHAFMAPLHQKAKALLQKGAIGRLSFIESEVSRNSGIGAWQYSIPSDASPATIDWKGFLGPAPAHPFDADRFFRWRKYWDYGTGVSGDMFVHRLSALHYMLDAIGPSQIMASGGVRYWNDGREAPDILTAILEYPETANHPDFTLILKANFADGSGGGPDFRFIGSEGVIELQGNKLTLKNTRRYEPSTEQLVEGYNSVMTFAQPQREEFAEEFEKYKSKKPRFDQADFEGNTVYESPRFDDRLAHITTFFDAMRNGGTIVQDPVFGLRAAAPAIIPNYCYQEGKVYNWNPVKMEVERV